MSIVNDERYRQAELLLNRRVSASAIQLHNGLEHLRQTLDLDWSTLLRSHRDVKQLAETDDLQSSIWLYWEQSAHPASLPLLNGGLAAVDSEIPHVANAISRFVQTARRLGIATDSVLQASIDRSLEPLRSASFASEELNEIGQRWQKRLHRAAVRKSALRVLTSETRVADQHVMMAEMQLLDSAPWAHMDRLLMAFELAHSDVRNYLRDTTDKIASLESYGDLNSVIMQRLFSKQPALS